MFSVCVYLLQWWSRCQQVWARAGWSARQTNRGKSLSCWNIATALKNKTKHTNIKYYTGTVKPQMIFPNFKTFAGSFVIFCLQLCCWIFQNKNHQFKLCNIYKCTQLECRRKSGQTIRNLFRVTGYRHFAYSARGELFWIFSNVIWQISNNLPSPKIKHTRASLKLLLSRRKQMQHLTRRSKFTESDYMMTRT